MRIATTSSQEMQPLVLGGQRVIDAAATITAVLTRMLSPAHAALFAEPEPDAARGEIDWYAEVQGPVAVLAELQEPAKAAAQAELDRLTTGISTLAGQLSESAEPNERRIGELLMLALNVPAPNCIKVTGTQPVLTGWGHQSAAAGNLSLAVRGVIRTPVAAEPMDILPPPAAMLAAGAARRGIAWPLLLLALLLLIPALWLLNQDFGLLSGARLCRIAPGDLAAVSAWRQAEAAGSVLDAELAGLDAKFAAQRANCQVPPPASPPVVPLLGPGGGQ